MNKLNQLIEESGLDHDRQMILKVRFQDYIDIADEWDRKAKEIKVTDSSQTELMKIAREGRLILRSKRTDIEKVRKEIKEQPLRECQAIDTVAKALKELIEPTEKYLLFQEEFAKREEEARINALVQERSALLSKYEAEFQHMDLGNMAQQMFDMVLEGAKTQFAKKQQELREAEEKRLAEAEAERIRQEEMKAENERLRKLAQEQEAKLAEERKKAEAERLKLIQEQEAKLAEERKKAEQAKQEIIREHNKKTLSQEDINVPLSNQSSVVDWIFSQLEEKSWENASMNRIEICMNVEEYLALKEQAKAMHKEEIEKAWWAGCDESLSNNIIHPSEDCNGYYNETFKIK